jgi:hypothetical protein
MSPRHWRAIVMVAVVFCGGLVVRSHAPDSGRGQQPGATLDGRIMTTDDRPIRRAHVVVSGPMTITTDADPEGGFHLSGLVSGTYTITPSKPGFVQLQPARVTVGNTATPLRITVLMSPAGAITGRVLNREGAIVTDAPITLLSKDTPVSQQLTDDRGVFRFHTLRDGTYTVWAATQDRTDALDVTLADARTVDVQIVLDAARIITVPEQPPPPPPMSPRPPEPAPGTRTIKGRITSAETGTPLPDVVLRLIGVIAGGEVSRSERTDVSGRFTFRNLPDGQYNIIAIAPPGYWDLVFGQQRLGDRTTLIVINGDHPVADADIALPVLKGLSGRLVDEFGDPAPDITVSAVQSMVGAPGTGLRVLVPIAGGRPLVLGVTNDLGEFRLRNLPPGEFYILALSGAFAGAMGGGPSAPPTYGYGFAPTFFPGIAAPADAQPIRIENGKAIAPIAFQLVAAGMGAITGRVYDPMGAPVPGSTVMLLQLHDGELRTMVLARTTTNASGVFHIGNVHAGSFVAQAFSQGSFASGLLEVVPGNATEIDLRVAPAAAIRGRFVFEGQHDATLLKQIVIRIAPTDFVRGPSGGNPAPFVISDDGTFEVPRVVGFNRLVFALPPPWTVISISSAGQDVTDRVIDWRDGDINDLQVRLAPVSTTVSGSVTGKDGRPLRDGFVLIVPQDQARLANSARYMRTLTTNAKGEFTVAGLPAGAYRAIPFETAPEAMTPDFFESVRGLGQGFTLGAGEAITIRLEFRK